MYILHVCIILQVNIIGTYAEGHRAALIPFVGSLPDAIFTMQIFGRVWIINETYFVIHFAIFSEAKGAVSTRM